MENSAIQPPGVGQIGEKLVAQWLRGQGSRVLAERWRCRWGELDLVVKCPASGGGFEIAFVEVKTRRQQNWDLQGLLAVTPQKQRKLRHAAQLFLADFPDLMQMPGRFDVALVQIARPDMVPRDLAPGSWVDFGPDRLFLFDYLSAAFE
ncbi:YraN family protein [Lyngbya confervoides]|uniref:UPF0102 protein QQ91_0016950 n=1 Tax=Lyngbya confervoides BDU141951 TaxID=1574623 RepID=A0ABD4T708_9CYAN|nr:YraN family protein [Lyngbya confervoides]MCM1984513.1 YraN family protein [Lyngbya confervoides BDU141951]